MVLLGVFDVSLKKYLAVVVLVELAILVFAGVMVQQHSELYRKEPATNHGFLSIPFIPAVVRAQTIDGSSWTLNIDHVTILGKYNLRQSFDITELYDALDEWCDPGELVLMQDGVVCNKTLTYSILDVSETLRTGIYIMTNGTVYTWLWREYYDDRDFANVVLYEYTSSEYLTKNDICLLYTSPSPRDLSTSRMPSSA